MTGLTATDTLDSVNDSFKTHYLQPERDGNYWSALLTGIDTDLYHATTSIMADSQQFTPPVVDESAPLSWDDYIGQHALKQHLQVRIMAALNKGARLPHTLLVANPGAGKTTIARLISQELGRPMITLTRPTHPDAIADHLFRLPDCTGILFVDEVHEWSSRQQHALMQLTESQSLDTKTGTFPFPNITVIAATTEPQDLEPALKSRFGVRPAWTPYSPDEMEGIVAGMAERAGIDPDVANGFKRVLAQAAAGIPRQARSLVEAASDMLEAGISPEPLEILVFAGIEADGLTGQHLDYLHVLGRQQDGKAGLEAISTMLSANRKEVRDLERLLITLELVALTGTGRQITRRGRQRIAAGRIT